MRPPLCASPGADGALADAGSRGRVVGDGHERHCHDRLADGPRDGHALPFGVTYWDHLRRKDIFATPRITEQQWDDARFDRLGGIATPQVWVNGRSMTVDNDGTGPDRSIADVPVEGPVLTAAKARTADVGRE